MTVAPRLLSTLSGGEYPFDRILETGDDGEPLEVFVPGLDQARPRSGRRIWQRFADFLPFAAIDESLSLGEGDTPLLPADEKLKAFTGLRRLLLKNETQNPTWSFKDRGSLTCVAMARQTGETLTATVSTGNMGHSMAAYGAKAGLQVVVFVPDFAPREKTAAMCIHGARVVQVKAADYSRAKEHILAVAGGLGLRVVSGNGPIRVEGYKLTAFEMYEQMEGRAPAYIAVPTSACGHIRGLFKGYRELHQAGLIRTLPRMIVVQAARNNPITGAIRRGRRTVIPVADVRTIAEAITSGNPAGGNEIIAKARAFGWPAEDVTEDEILESQQALARSGYFVEPAAATVVTAVRKLRCRGEIEEDAEVVLVLTGAGIKDSGVVKLHNLPVIETSLGAVEDIIRSLQRA